MTQGTWVLLTALLLAACFGGWRALRDGTFRGTRALRSVAEPDAAEPVAAQQGGTERGADALSGPDAVPGPDATDGLAGHLLAGGHQLGQRATLLQFSSAFCTPCRATRRVLGEVAALVPGVQHVEIDAEDHLALVRELGILRTPTTLVLDAKGREVSRASGAPRREAVLATLGRVLG